MDLYVVNSTCLLQSLKLRLRNPRGSCCLGVLLPLKVIAEGRSKVFGAVCDLLALAMDKIVGILAVLLVGCDSQHCTLLRMEYYLPLGFPVLQSG